VKSERDLVSQRYAQALVELVTAGEVQTTLTDGDASDKIPSTLADNVAVDKVPLALADNVACDLKYINDVIASSSDLKLLLDHPAYSTTQKKSVLQNIFMDKVQEITLCLLGLLVNRRRLDVLPAIERHYCLLLNEKRNIVTAQLVSSEPLTENSLADIKARLNEYLGKKLHLDMVVDPTLIAGYILRIKDQVIDGSLKGRLAGIEKALLSV
jgi:F-type H+-transporting ATPase subunit delta